MTATIIDLHDTAGRRRTPFVTPLTAPSKIAYIDWPAVASVQARRAADRWPVLPDNIELVTMSDGGLTVRPIRAPVAIPADAPSPVAWEAPARRSWLRRFLRHLGWA